MKGKVLVTGASGFVGRQLVAALVEDGWYVRAASRGGAPCLGYNVAEAVHIPDLAGPVDWLDLLEDSTHVVHLAAIAHVGDDVPESDYTAINTNAVRGLARAANERSTRVILMSSVKAQTGPVSDQIISEASPLEPVDPYGRSKLKAERLLAGECEAWTVLRPVLVYGPEVKGNMASLCRLARMRLPLPFASLTARRSLLAIDNLTAAVSHVLQEEDAIGRTFLVADNEAPTLPELITHIRAAIDRPSQLFAVSPNLLKAAFSSIGKRDAWCRISGSLVVDTSALKKTGWQPSTALSQGIAKMMTGNS